MKQLSLSISFALGSALSVSAQNFWIDAAQSLNTLLPAYIDGSKQYVKEIATYDIDGDGIDEGIAKTNNGVIAVFTQGNGHGQPINDDQFIQLVCCFEEGTTTLHPEQGIVRTYNGVSTGYEDECLYVIRDSRVKEIYHFSADVNAKRMQVTKYQKLSHKNQRYQDIPKAQYMAVKPKGDMVYTTMLTFSPVKHRAQHEPQHTAHDTDYTYNIKDIADWRNILDEEERVALVSGFFENAINALQTVDSNEEGWADAMKWLKAKPMTITADELMDYKKVRSTQFPQFGITRYSFFKCRFYYEGNTLWFDKISGSQRKIGELYRCSDQQIVFNGIWYIGNESKQWDSQHRISGMMKKVAPGKIIILFNDNGKYEIYDLSK